jgi:SsrA-binding protein
MAQKKKKKESGNVVARNRKARHDYFIEDSFEAGIILSGTEVKSLRLGRGSINEAYAGEKDGALCLFNAFIPEYESASKFNHVPRRFRKLLMHKREIARLLGAVQRDGMTLVPLSVYFNDRGIAKVELGLARGKHHYDKRASIKERDWKRDKARLLREKG